VGRTRKFDEAEAVVASRALFARSGYIGTSIDELTSVTGMLRGSLYGAFGSKMGLFRKCAQSILECGETESHQSISFLIVALKDVGSADPRIAEYCTAHLGLLGENPAQKIGAALINHLSRKE
jgi:AcrR family transcriptional regulator